MWSELVKLFPHLQANIFLCSCFCRKTIVSSLRELDPKILEPSELLVKDQFFKAKNIIQRDLVVLSIEGFCLSFNQIW